MSDLARLVLTLACATVAAVCFARVGRYEAALRRYRQHPATELAEKPQWFRPYRYDPEQYAPEARAYLRALAPCYAGAVLAALAAFLLLLSLD